MPITVVASQALITAVFSLTHQAIQLGYCPRMQVRHTSAETIGQIYLPAVNWALMVGCVLVVLEFRSSSRLASGNVHRVPGTAVFLAKQPDGAPATLLNHIRFNQSLHERVVLLTIRTRPVPRVPKSERLVGEPAEAGFSRVVASYGFLDCPDVEELLRIARERGAEIDLERTTFYIGRERIHATDKPGMFLWREKLFGFLQKLENPASNSFGLPSERVVELGVQLEI